MYPHFAIPNITFMTSDLSDFVAKDRMYSNQFKKIVASIKKDMPLFKSKVDLALNKTRDFTDQVVDKTMNVTGMLKGVLSMFGGTWLGLFTAVSLPMLGAIIAFSLSCCLCCPRALHDGRIIAVHIRTYYRKKRTPGDEAMDVEKYYYLVGRDDMELVEDAEWDSYTVVHVDDEDETILFTAEPTTRGYRPGLWRMH